MAGTAQIFQKFHVRQYNHEMDSPEIPTPPRFATENAPQELGDAMRWCAKPLDERAPDYPPLSFATNQTLREREEAAAVLGNTNDVNG